MPPSRVKERETVGMREGEYGWEREQAVRELSGKQSSCQTDTSPAGPSVARGVTVSKSGLVVSSPWQLTAGNPDRAGAAIWIHSPPHNTGTSLSTPYLSLSFLVFRTVFGFYSSLHCFKAFFFREVQTCPQTDLWSKGYHGIVIYCVAKIVLYFKKERSWRLNKTITLTIKIVLKMVLNLKE